MINSQTKRKKRGGIASIDYPYMLTPTTATSATVSTPNMVSGGTKARGGCGCASGSMRKGGNLTMPAGVELAPFISALALLGARMLADKNTSLNMSGILGQSKKSSSKSVNSLKSLKTPVSRTRKTKSA
jgi:hypothetical protein